MSKRYFESDNVNDLYLQLIESISKDPEYKTAPRGMKIKENVGVVVRLTNPRNCLITLKERKLNYAFAAIEKMEYLTGRSNPDRIEYYNKNFGSFKNEYGLFDGNYPDRLAYWYRHIYTLLKTDPDTRQAVMSIYGNADRHKSKDIPCTVMMHFLIRDNKLNLIVYMRSNDLLWGFPYDTNGFCFILEGMAAMLGIEMGFYELHAGSLHIYEEREDQLTKLLTNTEVDSIVNPVIPHIGFEELQQQLDLFWTLEYQSRNKSVVSSLENSDLMDWSREYLELINNWDNARQYKKKLI